jgi:hypothetical protein
MFDKQLSGQLHHVFMLHCQTEARICEFEQVVVKWLVRLKHNLDR